MGLKTWLRNYLKEETPEASKPASENSPPLSEKEIATKNGNPWVGVIGVELDADNVGNGAFVLDWNDLFVAKLVRAGFKGKTDQEIVDQWFTTLCRSIINEEFEQYAADPTNRK